MKRFIMPLVLSLCTLALLYSMQGCASLEYDLKTNSSDLDGGIYRSVIVYDYQGNVCYLLVCGMSESEVNDVLADSHYNLSHEGYVALVREICHAFGTKFQCVLQHSCKNAEQIGCITDFDSCRHHNDCLFCVHSDCPGFVSDVRQTCLKVQSQFQCRLGKECAHHCGYGELDSLAWLCFRFRSCECCVNPDCSVNACNDMEGGAE